MTQICVFLARFYLLGAHWVSMDHSVSARHTRSIKAFCHYFQILSSLFIKMSSDKDLVPSWCTAVCHQIPTGAPSIYWLLTNIFLTIIEDHWHLLSSGTYEKTFLISFSLEQHFSCSWKATLSSWRPLLRLDNPRSFNLSSLRAIIFFRLLNIVFALFSSWTVFLEMQAPNGGHSKSSDILSVF